MKHTQEKQIDNIMASFSDPQMVLLSNDIYKKREIEEPTLAKQLIAVLKNPTMVQFKELCTVSLANISRLIHNDYQAHQPGTAW